MFKLFKRKSGHEDRTCGECEYLQYFNNDIVEDSYVCMLGDVQGAMTVSIGMRDDTKACADFMIKSRPTGVQD